MSDRLFTEPSDWDELAGLVCEASDYVDASPQLRPQVVDGVRGVSRYRRQMRRLACLTLGAMAVAAVITVFSNRLQSLAPPRGVTSEQLHRMASNRAATAGVGFDWALSEVVTHWRSRMAASLETRGALPSGSAGESRSP